jgi:hypothetical protein
MATSTISAKSERIPKRSHFRGLDVVVSMESFSVLRRLEIGVLRLIPYRFRRCRRTRQFHTIERRAMDCDDVWLASILRDPPMRRAMDRLTPSP